MRTLLILAAGLVTAAAAASANAVTCYTLLDRGDHLLYQNSLPPVDMSDQGAAQREGLRRRNEYLLVADVESCQPVAAVAGSSGYRPANVDEIVGEMRGYLSYGGVSSSPGTVVGTNAGGGGPGAAPAPAAGSSGRARSSY
jgi:hypothetical protein